MLLKQKHHFLTQTKSIAYFLEAQHQLANKKLLKHNFYSQKFNRVMRFKN